MASEMIQNIFYCGGIGCLVFTVLLFILAGTGIFAAVRDENGKFKKPFNWKAILGFVIFISGFTYLMYWGNSRLINLSNKNVNLLLLFLNSFGIFMVIHLYDLLIIDYALVVKWHPKFLNLPQTEYYTSMKPHIEGFYRGILFGILISFLVAVLSYLL